MKAKIKQVFVREKKKKSFSAGRKAVDGALCCPVLTSAGNRYGRGVHYWEGTAASLPLSPACCNVETPGLGWEDL